MGEVLINVGAFLALVIIWVFVKITIPKISYAISFSKYYGILVLIVFTIGIIGSILLEYWYSLGMGIFFLLLVSLFMMAGGRSVPFKAMTGVFSVVGRINIGRLSSGSKHWVDPVFEYTTVDTNGELNVAVDLQHLMIHILTTPELRTSKKGVPAYVKNIEFELHLIEERADEIFLVEGGGKRIQQRVENQVDEILLHDVAKLDPDNLDTDKKGEVERLGITLQEKINYFCERNHFPYHSDGEITIGDIVLDPDYYVQQRKNVEAEQTRTRIKDTGKDLRPTGTEAEQVEAAMIALNITPKTIQEQKRTYNIDVLTLDAAVKIVEALKK